VVEALLLLLIGAQTAVGVRLLIRSGLGYRSTRCKDDGRFRYFLQRWSALLLLVFIAVHLAMFKLWPGGTTWVAVSRRFTLGGSRLMISFYALVVIGIAFHAGNGLWTGASVWGQRDKCPRLWLAIAGASGALVAVLGFTALRAFAV
jgi:succinate dehydrogenase/fumarate reductase cytochrome b subunit